MDLHENQGRTPEKMDNNEKIITFVMTMLCIIMLIIIMTID